MLITFVNSAGYKLEIEMFWLQASSQFFRDMLDSPTINGAIDPISVEESSASLLIFQTFMKGESSKLAEAPDLKDFEGTIRLLHRFDCEMTIDRVRLFLTDRADRLPAWDLFVLASWIDSEALAKSALARFKQSDLDWSGRERPVHKLLASNVDTKYIAAIMEASLQALCAAKLRTVFFANYEKFYRSYSATAEVKADTDFDEIVKYFKVKA